MNFKSKNIAFALIIAALFAPKSFAMESTKKSAQDLSISASFKKAPGPTQDFINRVTNQSMANQTANNLSNSISSFRESTILKADNRDKTIEVLRDKLLQANKRKEAMDNMYEDSQRNIELEEGKKKLAEEKTKFALLSAQDMRKKRDVLKSELASAQEQKEKKKARRKNAADYKQSIISHLKDHDMLNEENAHKLAADVTTDSENEFALMNDFVNEDPAIEISGIEFREEERPINLSTKSRKAIAKELSELQTMYAKEKYKNDETEAKIRKLEKILGYQSNARDLRDQIFTREEDQRSKANDQDLDSSKFLAQNISLDETVVAQSQPLLKETTTTQRQRPPVGIDQSDLFDQ